MKFLKFLLVAMVLPSLAVCQQPKSSVNSSVDGSFIAVVDTVNLGEVTIDDLSDDFGKIQISVKNTGTKPLIVNKVLGCCGTNIKEWPKAPILPGKEGVIKVEFRTEIRPQIISRTVTIESNAVNRKIAKVAILGVVVENKKSNEIVL